MRYIDMMPVCRSERIEISGEDGELSAVELYAREMSASDVIGMHETPSSAQQQELVAKSVVDGHGDQAFTSAELDRIPARIWRDMVRAVNRVNGIVEDYESGEG